MITPVIEQESPLFALVADLKARGEADAADVIELLYGAAVRQLDDETTFIVRQTGTKTAFVEFSDPHKSMADFIGRRFVLDKSYSEAHTEDES